MKREENIDVAIIKVYLSVGQKHENFIENSRSGRRGIVDQ